MKNYILICLILVPYFNFAQVGIGTTTPAAALDIMSTNAGILIPRVPLQSTTILSPLTTFTATPSELVYNTATAGDVTPGYYYLNTTATAWVRLANAADIASIWNLTGNAGTTASNFLGTTDSQNLVIRTGNTERMRVSGTTGNIGIGTNAAPAQKLTVTGGNIGLDNQGILVARNTASTYENVLYGRWSDNGTFLDGGTGGTSLRTNNGVIVNQYLGTNGNTSFGLPTNTVPTQRIDVGSGNIRIRDINLPASTSTNGTDRFIVVDASGILKTVVPETAIRTVNSVSNLPITAADETILVNTEPPFGNVLVTLPSPSGLKGKKYVVKKIDTSPNIVVVTSPVYVEGGTTNITINWQQSYIFQSDGFNWYIIARYN